MKDAFFQRRIVRPVLELLRQGTSPEKIALSIAFGLIVGIFPALGWSTALCFLAAVVFRLNVPAVQLVNYFVYPLQVALLIPFIRAGEFLFNSAKMPLSIVQILAMIKADAGHAINVLWVSTLHAVGVWALIAPMAIYPIYLILSRMLRRLARASSLLRPDHPLSAEGKPAW